MLYFSETAWTLPDIAEVNQAFDRECDQAEYEMKIVKLIRSLRAGGQDQEELEAWPHAVRALGQEDHYLLVMIAQAGASARPRGNVIKLWGTALAIVCIAIATALFTSRC